MDLLPTDSSDSETDDHNHNHNQNQNECTNKSQFDTMSTTISTKHHKRRRLTTKGTVTIVHSSLNNHQNNDSTQPNTFKRSKPHIRGNWAGHVFAPVRGSTGDDQNDDDKDKGNNDSTDDDENENDKEESATNLDKRIQASLERFRSALERSGWSGSVVAHDSSDLHISLSQPFYLQLGSIDSFVNTLSERLRFEQPTVLHAFDHDETVLRNNDGSRTFWCWRVRAGLDFVRMLGHVNDTMDRFGQAVFYDPPLFHISVGSVVGKIDLMDDSADTKDSDECSVVHDVVVVGKEGQQPGMNDDGIVDEEDGLEECLCIPVSRIVCTFGGTKRYEVSLLR